MPYLRGRFGFMQGAHDGSAALQHFITVSVPGFLYVLFCHHAGILEHFGLQIMGQVLHIDRSVISHTLLLEREGRLFLDSLYCGGDLVSMANGDWMGWSVNSRSSQLIGIITNPSIAEATQPSVTA